MILGNLNQSVTSGLFTIPKDKYTFSISAFQPTKEVMTIHADGRITVSEDAKPSETAKLVLEAMQGQLQAMLARAAQPGWEPLSQKEISQWWGSENGLEDCNMCDVYDFTQVVRAVEKKLGIGGEK